MTRTYSADAAPMLTVPFETMPDFGEMIEIADGILWTCIPLPYRLDHVNIYFLRDGDGWAVIDTGIRTEEAIGIWEAIFAGPMRGRASDRRRSPPRSRLPLPCECPCR